MRDGSFFLVGADLVTWIRSKFEEELQEFNEYLERAGRREAEA